MRHTIEAKAAELRPVVVADSLIMRVTLDLTPAERDGAIVVLIGSMTEEESRRLLSLAFPDLVAP